MQGLTSTVNSGSVNTPQYTMSSLESSYVKNAADKIICNFPRQIKSWFLFHKMNICMFSTERTYEVKESNNYFPRSTTLLLYKYYIRVLKYKRII